MRKCLVLPAALLLLAACSSSGSPASRSTPGDTITIRGTNMENTLKPGDRVRFTAVTTSYAPAVGDIVEYRIPSAWDASRPKAISRIVAIAGQTVRGTGGKVLMSADGGRTFRTLDEPYVLVDGDGFSANFSPVTVPRGRLWLMGDHRNQSIDSRYYCGPTPGSSDQVTACNPLTSTVPASSVTGYRRG